MNNLGKLKKISAILSLLVILGFLGTYLLFRDIKSKNYNISKTSEEVSFQFDKQEYLTKTERLIEGLSTDLVKIDSQIVSKDGDVLFIEGLEEMASLNGLDITIDSLEIQDDKNIDSPDITTLKIKAKTKGRWSSTYKFLNQLESMPYKLSVNNFSLANTTDIPVSGQRPTTPGPNWQSSFEIQVLKYK